MKTTITNNRKKINFAGLIVFSMYLYLFNCENIQGQSVNSWITSSDQSKLLEQQTPINFATDPTINPSTITINTNTYFQTIDGFGFCLTDGSAEVINGLASAEQDALLNELFNPSSGIAVSVLRIGIGASDLSAYSYSYDDLSSGTDVTLSNFSLAGPTATYTIPVLKKILAINPNIKILGSPWSAPKWMKTNNSWVGGSLNPSYFDAYANYFVKFIQAMQAEGINIWAVTIQNEPENPYNEPSMVMTSADEVNFCNNNLGPAFQNAAITTKIIGYDHNCDDTNYPTEVSNKSDYVDGAAFHLYGGNISAMSTVYNATGKNVYFTEQWTGSNETFASNLSWHMQNVMIGSANNWGKIAMEWNLANNDTYGPHTPGGCSQCKGAITVTNSTTYSRNPSYYIVAHMSKVIQPGALRIPSSSSDNALSNAAVVNPDGSIALVVYNSSASAKTFKIEFNSLALTYTVPENSAVSLLWDNTLTPLPVTSITSPANNTLVENNTEISISANASENLGTISKVEFYNGTTLLGTSYSAPYSYNWTPPTAGSYTLYVKAYDASSQYATSAPVNIKTCTYKTIPGKIESEDFDIMLGIQTENCSDAGATLDVGYTDANDWLEYKIDVASTGYYKVDYRVAGTSLGSLETINEAGASLGSLQIASSGGWQTWSTKSDTILLDAGKQTLKIKVLKSGWNINWMNFTDIGSTLGITNSSSTSPINIFPNPHQKSFTIQSEYISSEETIIRILNSLGETVKTIEQNKLNGTDTILITTDDLPSGIYLLSIHNGEKIVVQKIVKN